MAGIPRWKRLGYKTRYQYDSARAKRLGFRNYHHFQNRRRDTQYLQGETDAILEHDLTSKQTRRLGSEYNRRYGAMISDQHNDLSPQGPLAQWLVYIGRREPEDTHNVGDTDTVKGRN